MGQGERDVSFCDYDSRYAEGPALASNWLHWHNTGLRKNAVMKTFVGIKAGMKMTIQKTTLVFSKLEAHNLLFNV